MNIIVITAAGRIVVRPDTTWEKDNEDLYLPEDIRRLSYAPALFSRICKPGRSIGGKFTSRYYDGFGYGVLLYPEDWIDGSAEGYAEACCLDHSSFLGFPLLGLEESGEDFVLRRDGGELCRVSADVRECIGNAIEALSRRIYVRTGDLVAVELRDREPFFDRGQGNTGLKGMFGDRVLVDFDIIVE